MRKIFNILLIGFSILFFVLLFIFKNKLNQTTSTMIYAQLNENEKQDVTTLVDSLYNYSKSGLPYEITFLEFGSTGCSACKRMEKVMEEIREQYPQKVKVVFYNITIPKNQKLMKYYGVSVIPTQILLDNEGNEFFRHSGFISAKELTQNFKKN